MMFLKILVLKFMYCNSEPKLTTECYQVRYRRVVHCCIFGRGSSSCKIFVALDTVGALRLILPDYIRTVHTELLVPGKGTVQFR
jgi:hypothetical protein